MRKRKLNAKPLASDEIEERQATAPAAKAVPLGGQWGGAIKGQIAVTRRELDAARERLTAVREGVLRGVIALEIDTDAIVDAVGTDRIGDWNGDADFDALVRNIRERGQTQPIRVRPEDPAWRPAEADPLGTAITTYAPRRATTDAPASSSSDTTCSCRASYSTTAI